MVVEANYARDQWLISDAVLKGLVYDSVNLSNSRFTNVNLNDTRLANINQAGVHMNKMNLLDMTIEGAKVSDLCTVYEKMKG